MKEMQGLWGRKVIDLGFSSFLTKVEYLAAKHGKEVKKIERFYPSSKTCNNCGYVYKGLQLKERSWLCPECGTHHDRDQNAAKNIKKVGASTFAVGDIRPALAG